jgi:hypothetical protein
MIRFRYGLNQAGANSSSKLFLFSIKNKSLINVYSIAHALSGSKNGSDLSKNIAASSPSTNQSKSTKKSTPLEFSQTPKKYRRRPLTQDEIDLVTV